MCPSDRSLGEYLSFCKIPSELIFVLIIHTTSRINPENKQSELYHILEYFLIKKIQTAPSVQHG